MYRSALAIADYW